MKSINNLWILVLLISSIFMQSCKKDKVATSSPDTFITKDFTFNTATKQISPDATINGELDAPAGIKLIYCYLVRNNTTDSLIYTGTPAEDSRNNYKFSIPTANFSLARLTQVSGIRVMVKHLDNTSFEGFIKLTSFTPPLPKLVNVPTSLLPDGADKITLTGTASSENGLKTIQIFDDYQGTFVLVNKIDLTNNEKTYNLNYVYTYRKNAGNLKVLITDNFSLTAQAIINIPLKKYTLYQDVIMMANGTAAAPSNSSFFLGKTGGILGTCNISGQEKQLDFVTYCTAAPASAFTFYSPASTTTIAKNYKCGTLIWEPSTLDLKATKFRTLIPGTADVDRIYAAYNANTITDLEDAFFGSIIAPSSSTVKNDPVASASTFNLTAYLIWIRVPEADGSSTNQLLRVKEVTIGATPAVSTIKFDILVSK